MKFIASHKVLTGLIVIGIIAILYLFVLPYFFSISYSNQEVNSNNKNSIAEKIQEAKSAVLGEQAERAPAPLTENGIFPPAEHIKTPEAVKAIYVSAWVAGSSKYITPIISMIDTTELNSIVIDVLDSTGRVSFPMNNELVTSLGSAEKRIGDVRGLISKLHSKNIYVIGRISVFQDPYMTSKKPEWAVTKLSDGKVWKDKKGLSFLDPTNKEVWQYKSAVARTAYEMGFDEINFDYIRYPSDGNIRDINYKLASGATRASNIEKFFIFLSEDMKKGDTIPISADLFGLATVSTDDLGIGQVLEKALPYFDYVAPMVYPSHFANGWNGYKNPADYPYEVIHKSMSSAVAKAKAIGQDPAKLRPWLQDFDLGAKYTSDKVRAQMKGTYDSGLNSWMLWDPGNSYTRSALESN